MATTTPTFCRICEAACGLNVTTDNNRISKIEPDTEHVVSKGYACVKGLSLDKFVHSPDRLEKPLKKTARGFVEIPWEQALREIGDKLKTLRTSHGPQSLAAYTGNPIGFSLWPNMLMTGFLQGYGSDKLFTVGTVDCSNKFAIGAQMYGAFSRQTFPDIDHTNFLVVIGSNPAISKMSFVSVPHPLERLEAIEKRGGKVVWINPRKTESAKRFGEHLAIKPNTDVFLMLGILREVIERDAVDYPRIESDTEGFAELKRLASDWPLTRVSAVTGIDTTSLSQLIDSYLAADGAALYCSTGVNQSEFGALTFWLQECINLITGNLDRRGGTLMGKPVLELPDTTAEPKHSRIANTPYVTGMIPTGILADEILTPGEGQVKALFVMAGNPVLACANSTRLEQAMAALDLLVCIDLYRNETAEYADYILPGLHFLERADIPFYFMMNKGLMPTRYYQYTDALLAAPGEARDEALILRQIARRASFPLFGSRIAQAVFSLADTLGKAFPARDGLAERFYGLMARMAKIGGLRKIRQHPHGMLLEENKPGDYFGHRLAKQVGKVQLAPPALMEQSRGLTVAYDRLLSDTRLRLISKRERFSHNSWTHNVESFVKGNRNTNYLYIHPEDARALSLQDGQLADVSANGHSIRVPVKLDEDFMPGTVSVPHGWGHQKANGLSVAQKTEGANVNILASDGPEGVLPVSGMSQLNGIPVEVRAV